MRSQLKSIRIKNLRSIAMNERIKILPITILIGKNSAGKSTFARSFPLLRQSCEAKKRSPVLWFGDRVDFGSFDKSIRNDAEEKRIEFEFNLRLYEDASYSLNFMPINGEEIATDYPVTIKLEIGKSRSGITIINNIQLRVLGFEIEVLIDQTNSVASIKCGNEVWLPKVNNYTDAPYESILPNLTFLTESSNASKRPSYTIFAPFSEEISKIIESSPYAEIKEALVNLIAGVPFVEKGRLAKFIVNRSRYFIKGGMDESDDFSDFIASLEDKIAIFKINDILKKVDSGIKDYYEGVKYIEPLRATALRYYRKQELAIDEVDSKGENLAMFLDGMSLPRLEAFNRWTEKNFGFKVNTINEGGHVAVVITEENSDAPLNLADIGFGFSQMLPVITQIWLSTEASSAYQKNTKTSCIVIEQPELHLHPSFQSKLADVFAAAVDVSKNNAGTTPTQLVIETHSNHIVNRFGQLISQGKLKSKDVQILIFEKEEASRSVIRKAGFDSDGYLTNWPVGFFEPENY